MELQSLPSPQVLDLYYLETRCQILEIAAFLDRLDRGNAALSESDPRMKKIRQALALLNAPSATPNRAEQALNLFS